MKICSIKLSYLTKNDLSKPIYREMGGGFLFHRIHKPFMGSSFLAREVCVPK